MNLYERALMDKPSIEREDGTCAICRRPAGSRHHIVPRSHGGVKGPTVLVCGTGNGDGCHGLLHKGLMHLWWDGCWKYRRDATARKLDDALSLDGWAPVPSEDQWTTFGGKR